MTSLLRNRLAKIEAAVRAATMRPPSYVLELQPGEDEAAARARHVAAGVVFAPAVIVTPAEAPDAASWLALVSP